MKVTDLRWFKPNVTELLAENDSQKAAALQDFFSSVYTLETMISSKDYSVGLGLILN